MVSRVGGSITSFLDCLIAYQSETVFNPWANNCEHSDAIDSCDIRLDNLRRVFEACTRFDSVDLWIGRDLGWRGGRRTGVPLVDELTLMAYGLSIDVNRLSKATVDMPMKERTATEIHLARSRVTQKIFYWNVFPFHPHEKGKARSNRMHTREERQVGSQMLSMILDILPFGRLVAIGNDAANAVREMGHECWSVRHPSYGGQKEFHTQISRHYDLAPALGGQPDLFEQVVK